MYRLYTPLLNLYPRIEDSEKSVKGCNTCDLVVSLLIKKPF